MTNTQILEAMKATVEALDLPVEVTTRTNANVLGQLDKEPSELYIVAKGFNKAGIEPVKAARMALIDWYLDNKDRFADRKVSNIRGRQNKIYQWTYCDRYPEHFFFGLKIENR